VPDACHDTETSVGPCCISKRSVPDELWTTIEPLLPPEPLKPDGGRPLDPDRAAFAGIISVLKSGIPWQMLPKEFGCS
jgi:transposase